MPINDDVVGAAAEGFRAAGFGLASWEAALDGLAAATGSKGGQLVGIGSGTTAAFNLMTGVPPEAGEAFLTVGGGDPAVNSRVRIGLRAAELEVLDETAFTTDADMRLNPEYGAWGRMWDLRYACLTNLVKSPDRHVGLSLVRGERQGHVDATEKRAFAAIAAHAGVAVRTQLALDGQALQLLTGAMEAVRAAVFFCDSAGRTRTMTAAAEALVAAGDVIRLKNGVLTPSVDADQPVFKGMVAAAFAGRAPAGMALRSLCSDQRLFVEATFLPASSSPMAVGTVLIVVHSPGVDEQRLATAARSLYGLSASEAAITAQLSAGRSPAAIAHDRKVSLGTIRAQVRHIYQKVGVSSQLELAARLPKL